MADVEELGVGVEAEPDVTEKLAWAESPYASVAVTVALVPEVADFGTVKYPDRYG